MLLLPEWVGNVSHGAEAVLYYSVPVTLGVIERRDTFITVMLGMGEGEKGSCRHATVASSLLTYTQHSASLSDRSCSVCKIKPWHKRRHTRGEPFDGRKEKEKARGKEKEGSCSEKGC
ncbi:hypothetical protein QQF64_024972 [Cirrhinus molitorella]|uniref:Uncharacterized protein n=1 Tax=Cirrhinus molitorella TaxID=172907 RepID=A0ABR3NN40_9TELE